MRNPNDKSARRQSDEVPAEPIFYEDGDGWRIADLRKHGVDCIPLLAFRNFRTVRPGASFHVTETTSYAKMGAWWDRKGAEEIDLVCEDELGGEIVFYEIKRDPERFSDAKLQAKIEAFFNKNPEKRNLKHESGLLSLADM